jgi:outer membrane protein assembly factor BamB
VNAGYYIVVRVSGTTTYWASRVLIVILLTWGACPDTLVARQTLPPPKAGEDPFARFRKLDPDPVPLVPTERAWFVSMPFAPLGGGAMDAERVYIPLREDWLFALDRETGALAWRREIDTATAPLVVDGSVIVVSRSQLRALDASTAEDIWTIPLTATTTAPLATHNGMVIASVEPGIVIAFRPADGQELWRHSFGAVSPYMPAFSNENLLFTLADGRVVALHSSDGSVVWEQKLPGMLSEPATAPDRVFIGSTDNFFYALDASDGRLEWKWRGGGDVIGAAFDGKLVYFASLDNIVRAVNPGNGNQRWKKETTTRPMLPPLALEGVVVVPGLNPALTVFVGKTGGLMGTYLAQNASGAPQTLLGPPLIDPALTPFKVTIIAITRDGLVEGLRSAGLMFREPAVTAFGTTFPALPGRPVMRETTPHSTPSNGQQNVTR